MVKNLTYIDLYFNEFGKLHELTKDKKNSQCLEFCYYKEIGPWKQLPIKAKEKISRNENVLHVSPNRHVGRLN